MLRNSPSSSPRLRSREGTGCEWLHEVKFDGRPQLHLAGDDIAIYPRNGSDVTRRFRPIAATVGALAARSASSTPKDASEALLTWRGARIL